MVFFHGIMQSEMLDLHFALVAEEMSWWKTRIWWGMIAISKNKKKN